MNWVFGAYSNVYSTAMMQNKDVAGYLADAKINETKSVQDGSPACSAAPNHRFNHSPGISPGLFFALFGTKIEHIYGVDKSSQRVKASLRWTRVHPNRENLHGRFS